MSLAELDFIPTATNIVFIGPTGVGKSGLATGLLLKALQNGYRALFIKAQDLFDDDLYASLADRSSPSSVSTRWATSPSAPSRATSSSSSWKEEALLA